MQDSYEHLSPVAKAALELPDNKRIEQLRKPRWIGYTRANAIIDNLEDLLVYPKKDRMPNLLIVGETNNGKTMIARRFLKSHQAYDNISSDGITAPVMYIQAPSKPDVSRFYNIILEKLFAPFKANDPVKVKEPQVISILQRIKLQMLIIDEIHFILAGKTDKQQDFLGTMRYLGNELKIPIVGMGTKSAMRALQTDPQLSNRFEPAPLPRWHMDDEFRMLLASFEKVLPLRRPSELQDDRMASKLLTMSEGTIGSLSSLLEKAAIHAIKTKTEHINKKVLDSVDWIPPSDRKRNAERLI